ncbi:hypothetical protein [Methyloterricola oryzae]|uniref:hypothetical protein n=1 Tax=Methyloterricola oryzae TaxID=1495050 RepID=UPI0005EBC76E|nr:hypothetical protein [Methyloterricola oryzae]
MEEPISSQALVPAVPPLQLLVPYMTRQRYAELTGLAPGIVDAQVERGYLPSRIFGKHRLINVAQLWKQALEEETYL